MNELSHSHPANFNSAAFPGLAARSANIIGTRVVSRQKQNLGKVEEVVINDRIAYLVVSFGGFLGIGKKLYAVPWKSLHYDNGRQVFVLDVNRDALTGASGFANETWPQYIEERWNRNSPGNFDLALC